jgi:hypothetical protein
VKDVHLVSRENVDVFPDSLNREEMPAYIDERSSPRKSRRVSNRDTRNGPRRAAFSLWIFEVRWQQLSQRLHTPERAG